MLVVQRKFTKEQQDRSWWNLTGTREVHLSNHYPNWMELVGPLESVAQKHARRCFKEQLTDGIKSEHALLDEKKKMLEQIKPEDWKEEAKAIKGLKDALENWDIALETAGFLSINGSIRNT